MRADERTPVDIERISCGSWRLRKVLWHEDSPAGTGSLRCRSDAAMAAQLMYQRPYADFLNLCSKCPARRRAYGIKEGTFQ